ncbi:glycosyltransferase [Citricoccus sp. NR2]|uniref:glycosyltransferase n=1 Tax=Citricoccus sp. NR2 TaxID=3004095 RepID=UPI0022DE03A3|nr:hypothetical protein [Citricoccus sp. NR2]WBL19787.1 hypothetical protein O1A05_03585 [Citricoccus sp. NR2]
MPEQSQLPPLPRPYPHLRVGFLGATPLPQGAGTHIDLAGADIEQVLARGLDAVIVGSTGSDDAISPELLEVLIACESAAVPMVLRATQPSDLDSPVAAVVSQIAAETPELYELTLSQVGPERAFLIEPVIDAAEVLTAPSADKAEQNSLADITRRRTQVAEHSPASQARSFVEFLGLPTEHETLVTAVIISRHAKNLDSTLENLRRQNYPNIDPLLVIDPLYEQTARDAVTEWDIPVRVVVSPPRPTAADRLNLGVHHAHGSIIAVIEETGLYGPDYLTDQVQALTHSGAHLVGKASWYVWDADPQRSVVHAGAKQRRFDQIPALGTMVFHRETAAALGFVRRGPATNQVFAEAIRARNGMVFVSHAYDTVLLQKGQTLADLGESALNMAESNPSPRQER